jgi:hypothetical protein
MRAVWKHAARDYCDENGSATERSRTGRCNVVSKIELLLKRLHTEQSTEELRAAIIDATAETLEQLKADLGYWEKDHIAQTIAWVQVNVGISHRPTGAWLTVALLALHDAWAAPENRNELFTPRRRAIDALQYEDLAAALRQLGARVL